MWQKNPWMLEIGNFLSKEIEMSLQLSVFRKTILGDGFVWGERWLTSSVSESLIPFKSQIKFVLSRWTHFLKFGRKSYKSAYPFFQTCVHWASDLFGGCTTARWVNVESAHNVHLLQNGFCPFDFFARGVIHHNCALSKEKKRWAAISGCTPTTRYMARLDVIPLLFFFFAIQKHTIKFVKSNLSAFFECKKITYDLH